MERIKEGRRRLAPRNTLTRRWIRNAFGLIVGFLLLIVVLFVVLLRVYYYQSVRNALASRAELYQQTAALAGDTADSGIDSWTVRSREMVEYFTEKDKMELQALGSDGTILLSSTGFVPVSETAAPDLLRASAEESGEYIRSGHNATGEPVMSLVVVQSGEDGKVMGALRYVVSLRLVNRQILLITLLMCSVTLLIIFFVALSGSYFISSIVNPVTAIGRTARRIAMGEYDARLEKKYDDEIGDLCDTINYMAGEIAATEKLKNEFISSVSHELRTPLTAIKGWSETLQGAPEDHKLQEKGLSVIGKEAERLSGIVEELLDFSRMQSGHMTMHMERMDVLAELEEAVFLFQDKATRRGIQLQYFEENQLPAVQGDPDRIRQVFINILDNAVKYTDAGGRVRVEAAAMADCVQAVISDTGVGISAKDLPRIRQKFFKADSSRPGSGIGLALADEIVRMHGGRLEIDSEPGVGTTVTVLLPFATEESVL